MVKFIFIRHGYSIYNKEKRFTGQKDIPLDEIGFIQAERAGKYITDNYKVDAVYSSDLIRACDTAKPIADKLKLPIFKTEAFREINVGVWQGVKIEDVRKNDSEAYEKYTNNPGVYRFEGGESFYDVIKRASDAICRIAKENGGKTVVVATHGGVIRALRTFWSNIPLERMNEVSHVSNASITVISYDEGKVEYLLEAYTGHLE